MFPVCPGTGPRLCPFFPGLKSLISHNSSLKIFLVQGALFCAWSFCNISQELAEAINRPWGGAGEGPQYPLDSQISLPDMWGQGPPGMFLCSSTRLLWKAVPGLLGPPQELAVAVQIHRPGPLGNPFQFF